MSGNRYNMAPTNPHCDCQSTPLSSALPGTFSLTLSCIVDEIRDSYTQMLRSGFEEQLPCSSRAYQLELRNKDDHELPPELHCMCIGFIVGDIYSSKWLKSDASYIVRSYRESNMKVTKGLSNMV